MGSITNLSMHPTEVDSMRHHLWTPINMYWEDSQKHSRKPSLIPFSILDLLQMRFFKFLHSIFCYDSGLMPHHIRHHKQTIFWYDWKIWYTSSTPHNNRGSPGMMKMSSSSNSSSTGWIRDTMISNEEQLMITKWIIRQHKQQSIFNRKNRNRVRSG